MTTVTPSSKDQWNQRACSSSHQSYFFCNCGNKSLHFSPLPVKNIGHIYVINFTKLGNKNYPQDLIDLGAKHFWSRNFPIGYYAAYLTLFQTVTEEDHDSFTGCLQWLNEFGEHHNEQLKTELKRLQKLYPHINIIYADYYNSLYRFYLEPAKYSPCLLKGLSMTTKVNLISWPMFYGSFC